MITWDGTKYNIVMIVVLSIETHYW